MAKGFGPTGKFPEGRLNEADEGEIQFGVAADPKNNVVVLNFGKPVAWIGMPPENARQIALALLRKAGELDGVVTQVSFEGDRNG
jgi:hypothetical protein